MTDIQDIIDDEEEFIFDELDIDYGDLHDLAEEEEDEYYDQLAEENAWQETLVDIKKAPCPMCGATERHTVHNDHDGRYWTYDVTCSGCGYVIVSHMD
jgi:predicted RNA-binding Zn-ribbon protein involved in translation (DUF1610 family)